MFPFHCLKIILIYLKNLFSFFSLDHNKKGFLVKGKKGAIFFYFRSIHILKLKMSVDFNSEGDDNHKVE